MNNNETNHEKIEPIIMPYRGMNLVAANAYKLTDIEPNIIGPTAPRGTFSPCEIQSATIVVKNIAGNTDAMPANKGEPC